MNRVIEEFDAAARDIVEKSSFCSRCNLYYKEFGGAFCKVDFDFSDEDCPLAAWYNRQIDAIEQMGKELKGLVNNED